MARLLALGIAFAVLVVTVGSASATPTVPWFSIAEAKRSIFNLLETKVIEPGATDWNVSGCFRLAPNKIQCRWSERGYSEGLPYQCFGNARAVAKNDGYIYSRTTSAHCE